MASYLTDMTNKLGLSSTPSSGGRRRRSRRSRRSRGGGVPGHDLLVGPLVTTSRGGNAGKAGYLQGMSLGGRRGRRRKTRRKSGGAMDVLAQASVPFGMMGLQRMVGKNMYQNQSKRRNRTYRKR